MLQLRQGRTLRRLRGLRLVPSPLRHRPGRFGLLMTAYFGLLTKLGPISGLKPRRHRPRPRAPYRAREAESAARLPIYAGACSAVGLPVT